MCRAGSMHMPACEQKFDSRESNSTTYRASFGLKPCVKVDGNNATDDNDPTGIIDVTELERSGE
jgi:hypothetical protein